jgi:SAM-dependent methyltransferase
LACCDDECRDDEPLMSHWRSDRGDFSTSDYDARWKQLERLGHNPHGEVDRLMRYAPCAVLDAGCGTGRVAMELAARGVAVVIGLDLDAEMLAAARAKAPQLKWVHGDLVTHDLGRTFDLVALPGNVMVFIPDDHRPDAVANLARHLDPGGLLVAGFQLERPGRPMTLAAYDQMCAVAGLELMERSATWDGEPYVGGDYAVSVHQLTA